ncbi:MAG TPA: PP2C family protein-serine/threonine phosphatase [Vicinamibacterales bacterium]
MAREPDRGAAGPVHQRVLEFFDLYTRDLHADDLQRVFTRETPEAWQVFARAIRAEELGALPWHLRVAEYVRRAFLAFTMRLSPARRAIYGIGLVMAFIGLLGLFNGIRLIDVPVIPFVLSLPVPAPDWPPGTMWLAGGFLVLNFLILLEVADRLTLKRDLEVAREIQQAMLPREVYTEVGVEGFGMTQPANTVGGDLYDLVRRSDGRIALALGDVAGKGSPAALLMALAVAMLRVLVDEGLEPAELATRLNGQIARHAPGSRFITLFVGLYDPATGSLDYVNAGQNPPMLRRVDGRYERLTEGGVALGLFDAATYAAGRVILNAGDVLVLYSDGITEAENAAGVPFDEPGLQAVIDRHWWKDMQSVGTAIIDAVRSHAAGTRIADDLTVLAVRRPIPLPGAER